MMDLELCLNDKISYVTYHTKTDILARISVENTEDTKENVTFRLRSEPEFFKPIESRYDFIHPYQYIDLKTKKEFNIDLDINYISSITERVPTKVILEAIDGSNNIISECSCDVEIMPFNYWPGSSYPEYLIPFITPNADSIDRIKSSASDVLNSWGEAPSLEGYQGNRDRVLKMGAAVFSALEKMNITYVNPPAGFENNGQRIRMSDEVVNTLSGTCLDLSILYASVMESIGTNTLLFIIKGHAFAGFWLDDQCMQDISIYDSSRISREVRNNVLAVVECTAFTNDSSVGFEKAREVALNYLDDPDNFVYALDVRAARGTFTPLPTRKNSDGSWVVTRDERETHTTLPTSAGRTYDDFESDRPVTKVDKWARELLDISTKNALVSMKNGKKLIPLLITDISELENRFAEGIDYTIYHKPQDWDGTSKYGEKPFEVEYYIGNYRDSITNDLSRNRIRSPLTEHEIEQTLRSIYRYANKDLEENGCNSLFLTLGTLRWYESGSKRPRYAPLIMVPVKLVKSHKGYSLKKLDEETLFNVTILEKMKQDFELKVPNMDVLPVDESGVDVEQIVHTIRKLISSKEGWEVINGASLGIFSFSQYVMWKDLLTNIEDYKKNVIVDSLCAGTVYSGTKEIDEDSDPYGLCLTVPADGSQIKAVKAVGNGRTFIMHGPPGTGKSQTITNIICNELYNGRTVLFVAEKRAALEVVQKRLVDVGIGNRCLELHSNKTEKSKILAQIKSAYDQSEAINNRALDEILDHLIKSRDELDSYVSALHKEMPWGLSAYECICRYQKYDVEGATNISIPSEFITQSNNSKLYSLNAHLTDAHRAYSMVPEFKQEELRELWFNECPISIEEDYANLISAAKYVALGYLELKDKLSSLNLPVNLDSPEDVNNFVNTVLGMDESLVRIKNMESSHQILKSLSDESKSLMTEISKFESATNIMYFDFDTLVSSLSRIKTSISELYDNKVLENDVATEPLLSRIDKIKHSVASIRNDYNCVLEIWNSNVFSLNKSYNLIEKWNEAYASGFIGKLRKKGIRNNFMQTIGSFLKMRSPPLRYEELQSSIQLIDKVASIISDIDDSKSEYVRDATVVLTSMLERLNTLTIDIEGLMEQSSELDIPLNDLSSTYDKVKGAKDDLFRYREIYSDFSVKRNELCKFINKDPLKYPPKECLSLCESIETLTPYVFDWANWNKYANILLNMGLKSAIDKIYEGMSATDLNNTVYRSIYKGMFELCRREFKSLHMFNTQSFERTIRSFMELNDHYTSINKKILKFKLCKNIPSNSGIDGTEAYVLNKALNSSRMRKSIRSLLGEVPNLLPKLCPCFLMSPLSVSQYLTKDYPRFDTVIFDESSQITTCKAITSLGRGKNAVIAGDSKQLPPTTFFKRTTSQEGDEDDDMMDIDSFLDDCLSTGIPETYLEWHYRSRHESLIAFSNRMFYGDKMMTFPSPNDQEAKVSIKRVDGTYVRKKSNNEEEAIAVVDEIRRRVMDPVLSKYSIGVVAFSVSQQEAIQDKLDDLLASDPELFDKMNEAYEPIFIKNLETVQGDERDVILFSIGYGPDSTGHIYQNFGPINREGGGRRLNVAVSRARYEMIIFSSLKSTDIKVTAGSRSGVKYLQEFLRFAESNGHFDEFNMRASSESSSSIIESVASKLKDHGYDVHFGVGNSGFKVDVAIINPQDSSKYILGLLADGDSYRDSLNTRDREYARASVLKGLGWELMNIWSVDWYYHKDMVIENILKRIDDIQNNKEQEIVEEPSVLADLKEPVTSSMDEISLEKNETRAKPYKSANISPSLIDSDVAVSDPYVIRYVAIQIIDGESPINEDYLIKLYAEAVGIHRLSAKKREMLVQGLHSIFNCDVDGPFVTYWKEGEQAEEYDAYRVNEECGDSRDFQHISLPEILNAMDDVVQNSGSIKDDAIVRAVARALGFSRTGSNVTSIVNSAIPIALREKILVKNGEVYVSGRQIE